MIEQIEIDSGLADKIDQELHTIKIRWQYSPTTTNFINLADDQRKTIIKDIMEKFPVIDTQKFSESIYNETSPSEKTSFVEIRQNPNSRYNLVFPHTAELVNTLQQKYIPSTYRVSRIIINMQTIRPVWNVNAIHPDSNGKGCISILYYANDSDGDTLFFEGSECVFRKSPVKGTAVMYPSSMLHAGSCPIKTETRVVINMMFRPKYMTVDNQRAI